MASIRKRGSRYQVQIDYRSIRKSKTFTTKREAIAWGRRVESEIDRHLFVDSNDSYKPFSDLLDLYEREIMPNFKDGGRNDRYRAKRLRLDFGGLWISKITPAVVRKYRDKRLTEVKPGTVRKELGLISRVFSSAVKDFGIALPKGNPVTQIRLPVVMDARERRLSLEETKVIEKVEVFRFAIETCMRRSEISRLRWCDINLYDRTLHIPVTKTGKPRTIPLSSVAMKLLMAQPIDEFVWGISNDTLSRSFMKLCRKHDFDDLRFHDLRHEGTSRLIENGLSVMEVASITGHSSMTMLERYTHLDAKKLAKKLV